MKAIKTFAAICIASALVLSAPSCTVLVKKDNGKHKGWYKNTNNLHNPAHGKTTTVKTNGNGTKVKVKTK
jgi:hypothetical protein